MKRNYDEILLSNLRTMIKVSGKQHKEIAEALNVTPNAITEYLAGRSTPSTVTVKKMCKLFNCRYEDLLGELD